MSLIFNSKSKETVRYENLNAISEKILIKLNLVQDNKS